MEKDNPNALFANGWGRRGHFALLVAPSGVGKSAISTQLLVPWTAGKPGLVGSEPLRALRVAIIQAEDDDTEMGEFRRDHRRGHVAEGWTLEDVLAAERKVRDWSPFFKGLTGAEFIDALRFAAERDPRDVVILNPLQSYTDFDISKNAELSEFLRKALDPVLAERGLFMLCVHHTNKPPTGANVPARDGAWGEDALAAYVGAGGAELTNYARSVTFIRRCTAKECAVENSFMLIGAKRGNRLGWKDADGAKTNKRIIAYSEDYIHWRVPSPEEIASASSSANPPRRPDVAATAGDRDLNREAASSIADLIRRDWPKQGVKRYCRDRLKSTLSRDGFAAGWEYLLSHLAEFSLRKVDDGARSYHFEHDPDAAQATLAFASASSGDPNDLPPPDSSPGRPDLAAKAGERDLNREAEDPDPETPEPYWNV